MVDRIRDIKELDSLLDQFPVVGIVGARQVGKTTLARILARQRLPAVTHFDLEHPEDQARLRDPMLALKDLGGLVIIDEIQRAPDIFPVLRVLADREDAQTRFLILGSASPEMLRQGAESLAGRIAYHELGGFTLEDGGIDQLDTLWIRGGFPRSFLAADEQQSMRWRTAFIQTFLERDLGQLGITIPATTLRRFWNMVAHYHGQLWNASEFSRSFGISDTSVRRYLDILTSALVLRQLSPWHENVGKRQVKSPKVYVADSGMLHALLGIDDLSALEGHPKLGASWEGFLLDQIIRLNGLQWKECFFWRTYAGAELDLLIVKGNRRIGFEIKRTSSPSLTPSMRNAIHDLALDQCYLVHAGQHSFPLADHVDAISASRIGEDLTELF